MEHNLLSKILILGGDGYLGWPTAIHFASKGWEVCSIDNYAKRRISSESLSQPLVDFPQMDIRTKYLKELLGLNIEHITGDLRDYDFICDIVKNFCPDTIVHYAEQPSAPYSMHNYDTAFFTLQNNLEATFNVLWAVMEHAPECHIIKLGTMGEYGTPNIDIEEGWLDVTHNGRKSKFLYPRAAGSLYHTTKVLDTDLIWFYVRNRGITVTDLMQGPVYGLETYENVNHPKLYPHLYYDDIFGTVLNRFLVQAVAGIPLTVYGEGGQTRGYLNIKDTLQCVFLAAINPPPVGELKIMNQFTETFSVNELAKSVQEAANLIGMKTKVQNIKNPRKELENHYYNPKHTGFKELGIKPHLLNNEVLVNMLDYIRVNASKINTNIVMPRQGWS
jgi:UDP-sulfoquinovose synthase